MVAIIKIISDFGPRGGLTSTGISPGNSIIRIFGIYPTASGKYLKDESEWRSVCLALICIVEIS